MNHSDFIWCSYKQWTYFQVSRLVPCKMQVLNHNGSWMKERLQHHTQNDDTTTTTSNNNILWSEWNQYNHVHIQKGGQMYSSELSSGIYCRVKLLLKSHRCIVSIKKTANLHDSLGIIIIYYDYNSSEIWVNTTQFVQLQTPTFYINVVLNCDAVLTVFKTLVSTCKSTWHHNPEQKIDIFATVRTSDLIFTLYCASRSSSSQFLTL
jgi:hypothetical protein